MFLCQSKISFGKVVLIKDLTLFLVQSQIPLHFVNMISGISFQVVHFANRHFSSVDAVYAHFNDRFSISIKWYLTTKETW